MSEEFNTTYTTSANVRSGNEVTYTTSRVDQDCRCCRSGSGDTTTNMLKVVWGNDVSISIQLSKKVGESYEEYDLSDGEDYKLNIVNKYGDRIEFPIFIADNKIKFILDSRELESNVPYSIEVLWQEGPYDKRVFGRDMFMYVNSSIDATPSDTSITPQTDYEYNIVMEGDVCYISIGQIPDVDLSNYVTQGELTTQINQLWQDCNDQFVDNDELADAIDGIDLTNYVTDSELNTTLSDYVQTSALDDYVQTSALDDYVTDTELQDAIAGVTIDESNLVHKTGDEAIGGTKTFANRILGQQGMTISRDILAQGAGVSHNLLGQYIANGIQTGRISSSQIAVSEIIGPHTNSQYTPEERDAIKFCRNTANNERDIVLDQMAKIDSNGIYEGSTLLENKYLQIADLPSIPTATSDLTNDSGFITNSDLTTIESDITSLDGRVTTLENNPSVPSNVVVSDDVNEIVCLTQSQYDALVQSQQLDPNTLYDITDAPSNFVTQTSLNTTLQDYVTASSLNTTLGDYVTDTDLQTTISGLSIPTATSDLTNDSGFITNSDLTTALTPIESDITSLDGRVTTLEQSGSGVSQEDWDNANEAIAQELTDNRLAHLDINNQFSNYYTKTESDSRYATQSWANNKFVTQSDDVNRQQAIAAAFAQSQDDLDSLDSRVTTLEQSGGGGSVPSNVVVSDDGNEIICLTQTEYDTLEQNQQLESDVFYYITDATSNYVSQSDLTNYVTQTELNTAISGVTIDETNLVHKTGNETINGNKTFRGECEWTMGSKFGAELMPNNSDLMNADIAPGMYKTGLFIRPTMLNGIIGQIIAPNGNVNYDSTHSIYNESGVIKFQKIDSVSSPQKPNLSMLAKIDSNGIYEGTTLLSNKYAQISSVPTATSDLTNDSGFVSSSSVTNIWQGSQSDYNNISTPDPNTLYIIV